MPMKELAGKILWIKVKGYVGHRLNMLTSS